MKHMKILGLLVATAALLTAFAGSASAFPILTSPVGVDYTGEIHMTLEKGTSLLLKAGIEKTCTESTIKAKIETNNTEHAAGPITTMTLGGCTQDTKVITAGRLTIDDKGTVLISERREETKITSLGVTCFYGAEATPLSIGDLTAGTPATIDINTTHLKRLSGSNTFFCAAEGTLTGSYIITTPSSLFIT